MKILFRDGYAQFFAAGWAFGLGLLFLLMGHWLGTVFCLLIFLVNLTVGFEAIEKRASMRPPQ
jgi:hypothetical protein